MNTKERCLWIAVMTLVACIGTQGFVNRSYRKRIERLEDRAVRMTEHINNHFEIGHGLKWAEIHSGLTAQESSNLWFAYQFYKTNKVTEAKEDKP